MSSESWPAILERALVSRSAPDRPPRIALVGVGQDLHGDDAVGLEVIRALRRRLGERDGLLLIEAGPAPENVTGALRRFAPSLIVLVDAAMMDEAPGTVRFLDPAMTDGISASSHTLPPSLVADFLARELRCAVCLLGIEPDMTDFPAPRSAIVRRATGRIASRLAALLASSLAARGEA